MINKRISEQINQLSREIYDKEFDLRHMVNSAHFDIVDTMNLCLEIMLLQSRMVGLKELVLDLDPGITSNQNIN